MTERYGQAGDFLRLFNPSMQYRYCSDLERCYLGSAPTLWQVERGYGGRVAETWLEIQLNQLSEFAGCKEKMDVGTTQETARQVMFAYGHLKVTEFMHFMLLLKGGRYGRFYGSVDPMAIMEALGRYARETRPALIDGYEAARRRERYAEDRRRAITWEEYLRRKGEAEGGKATPDETEGLKPTAEKAALG